MRRYVLALIVGLFFCAIADNIWGKERPAKLRNGAVAGTAYWLAPFPDPNIDLPIHTGDDHPGDWRGAKDAVAYGLADVVISAFPIGNTKTGPKIGRTGFPETESLEYGLPQGGYVAVATSHTLEIYNYGDRVVRLNLVKDRRVRLRVTLNNTPTADMPPRTDLKISSLEEGVYEIIDADSEKREGWLYRAAIDELVVGATGGNCRYSINLMPGTYRIRAWHPHLLPVEKIVKIRARIATRFNPVFSENNLPKHE